MSDKFKNLKWALENACGNAWDHKERSARQLRIIARVREEIEKLDADERDLIEKYWYEGKTMSEIARGKGRPTCKLESFYKQVMRKLKNRLRKFVEMEFKIVSEPEENLCPICSHPCLKEIDDLLVTRRPEETLSRFIRILKLDYGIVIKTPQVILGHLKYHRKEK